MKLKLIAFAAFLSSALIAQPQGVEDHMAAKKEKIQAMKVAYLTTELDLNIEESQAFWPVYNEVQEKELALREKQAKSFKRMNEDSEKMTDKELEKLLIEIANTHIELETLHRDYIDDYIKVIGARKTANLMRAEKEFGRKVLERMRDQRPEPGRRPGGGPMDGAPPMQRR